MKQVEIIVTTEQISEKMYELLKRAKLNCNVIPKCNGFSQHTNFLEFIGFSDTRVEVLIFKCKDRLRKFFLKFLLTNCNKPNNGIMFSIGGDRRMKADNRVLVVIINAGHGEKVADILRKEGALGATMFNARGAGVDYDSVMGMSIDSSKQVIFSVMPKEMVNKMSKIIKTTFKENKENCVLFDLPVSNYNKLHEN
jgi:nitrogen regulatory protein P-II 1